VIGPENIRADMLVECTDCGAKPGEVCIGRFESREPEPALSHFARRIRRVREKGVLKSERPDRGPWLVLEEPS
jgi:hypothetical protein